MSVIIKSGDSGNTARVTDDSRLRTSSVVVTRATDAALNGDTFYIISGIVELTDSSASHILYFKNDDELDWVLDLLDMGLGASTGAPGKDFSSIITVNPTGGTLITAGTPVMAFPMNLGSSKPLAATIFSGAQGSTITGGNAIEEIVVSDVSDVIFRAGPVVIPPGSSASVGFRPAVGNTSMNTDVSIIIFRIEDL